MRVMERGGRRLAAQRAEGDGAQWVSAGVRGGTEMRPSTGPSFIVATSSQHVSTRTRPYLFRLQPQHLWIPAKPPGYTEVMSPAIPI